MPHCLNAARLAAALVTVASFIVPRAASAQSQPAPPPQDTTLPAQQVTAPPPEQPASTSQATPPPPRDAEQPRQPPPPNDASAASARRGDGAALAWAPTYARGSIGMVSASGLFVVPQSSTLLAGSGGATGIFALDATVRIVVNHFVIQPSFGFGITGFRIASGTSNVPFTFTPGIGLGAAIALNNRLALTPMLRNDYFIVVSSGTAAFITVLGELPLTIFLGRNGFIEPYLNLGAAILTGGGTGAVFALGAGYRLGVVF